jgi:phenylalanyl-tRNA synthetase alpha chain
MVDFREQELTVLSIVGKLGGKVSIDQLILESNLSDSAVMRAALVLKENKFIKIFAEPHTLVNLSPEGVLHAKNGLPERRLLDSVIALGGAAELEKAYKKSGLSSQFEQIALGWILRKKWSIFDSKNRLLKLSDPKKLVPFEKDEKLLGYLNGKKNVFLDSISDELQSAIDVLRKRKLLFTEDKINRVFEITTLGSETLKGSKAVVGKVTQLTPNLILTGKWRKVKLQEYNIKAPVAKTWSGKKHPYLRFLEEVRTKLVTLGFKEMTGSTVELSFFNFDALYTPQDHPAREIFGIYQLKNPKFGDISAYASTVEAVKATHENGWKTGSSGWDYNYSREEARRLVLRGHGTCLSARTLQSKKFEIPCKYFSIARCYRPEVADKTHLSEFNQVEGIVVDDKLNLRDLLGVLAKFAIEVAGADKVQFKPDYFPFTEPSVELSAFKKGYGWIEFGGSGIFRPEVTLPLGVNVPVIAWGLGIDRLFMMKSGVTDIRDIFSQSLDWLRRKEVV